MKISKNGITITFIQLKNGNYSYAISNPEWDKQFKINNSQEIGNIDYAAKIIFDIIFTNSYFYQKAISELNELHFKKYKKPPFINDYGTPQICGEFRCNIKIENCEKIFEGSSKISKKEAREIAATKALLFFN